MRYETSGNILDILTDVTEGQTLLTDHINALIEAIELSSIELAVDTVIDFIPGEMPGFTGIVFGIVEGSVPKIIWETAWVAFGLSVELYFLIVAGVAFPVVGSIIVGVIEYVCEICIEAAREYIEQKIDEEAQRQLKNINTELKMKLGV